MLLGILRVSSPRLRRPQVEARPPGPLRDSDRLDAATDQNRATKRQPLPPCWSPARATPAPPSPARLSAPGSIAPYDIIVLLFATQIKHKSRTPIHDGPLTTGRSWVEKTRIKGSRFRRMVSIFNPVFERVPLGLSRPPASELATALT